MLQEWKKKHVVFAYPTPETSVHIVASSRTAKHAKTSAWSNSNKLEVEELKDDWLQLPASFRQLKPNSPNEALHWLAGSLVARIRYTRMCTKQSVAGSSPTLYHCTYLYLHRPYTIYNGRISSPSLPSTFLFNSTVKDHRACSEHRPYDNMTMQSPTCYPSLYWLKAG